MAPWRQRAVNRTTVHERTFRTPCTIARRVYGMIESPPEWTPPGREPSVEPGYRPTPDIQFPRENPGTTTAPPEYTPPGNSLCDLGAGGGGCCLPVLTRLTALGLLSRTGSASGVGTCQAGSTGAAGAARNPAQVRAAGRQQ